MLQLILLLLLPTALYSLTAAHPPLLPRQAPSAPCPTGVHIIAIRGHGTDNTTGRYYGKLDTLNDDILAAIPGSNSRGLVYPSGDSDDAAGVSAGADDLHKYISEYVDGCPTAHLVLLGYSEGAVVTMNTLCGPAMGGPPAALASSYKPNILATILYGDETYTYPQPYDAGTCKENAPLARNNSQGCAPFIPTIRSYCDAMDPYCCTGGTKNATHDTYPERCDHLATAWVVSKYNATM